LIVSIDNKVVPPDVMQRRTKLNKVSDRTASMADCAAIGGDTLNVLAPVQWTFSSICFRRLSENSVYQR
jgi:hypothetical protein